MGDAFGQGKNGGIFAPGLDFAFGVQDGDYLRRASERGWLMNSDSVATPATTNAMEDFQFKMTLEPFRDFKIKETPDRSTLQAVQTPQVFDIDLLRGALKKAKLDGAAVTDDCSAVELMGMSVKIVEGDERNLKVTTPMDLKIAELLLEEMA